MIKFVFKWALRLAILAAVVVVIFLLSLDSLLRLAIEHNIRAQTGMDAEIGKFHIGLTEPVVEIRDLQLHNPPQFGGTPLLNISEIHVEYDRAALAKNQIHITLLRFNLGELDIVKNESGQTNLFALGLNMPAKNDLARSDAFAQVKRQSGFEFKGIDVLNVSVGGAKYIDLGNPKNNREQKLAIDNLIIKNVQQPADLAGLAVLVALRGGDFFGPLLAPTY